MATMRWFGVLFVIAVFAPAAPDALERQFALIQKFEDVQVGEPRNTQPIVFNNYLLFVADEFGETGLELWASLGDGSNTFLLYDIREGSQSSEIDELVVGTGCVFFGADDGNAGKELWRTDGLFTNTFMISDINPGIDGSEPAQFTDMGGTNYFVARTATHGSELWTSTCAVNSAARITDICAGPCDSNITDLVACNGRLYFAADDGIAGNELWTSTGTPGNQLLIDVNPGGQSSFPRNLYCFNNEVYFSANDTAIGSALWRVTGTALSLVIDTNQMVNQFGPENIGSALNKLVFSGNQESEGYELFTYDPVNGAKFIQDINEGKSGSRPGFGSDHYVEFDGKAIFPASSKQYGLRELWGSLLVPTTAPADPEPFPENGTYVCEILTSYNSSIPCAPNSFPLCELPLTETVLNETVIVNSTTTISERNITINYPNGTSETSTEPVINIYNTTQVIRTTTIISLNDYPCQYNRTLQGFSAKDFEFPEGNSTTFLYCDVSNSSSAPMDMQVITGGTPRHMTFRARNQQESYQLYIAIEGLGPGDPATGSSLPSADTIQPGETHNGTGHCEPMTDLHGFTMEDVQKPVQLPYTGYTYFFGRKGNVKGLWYMDAQPTPVAIPGSCPSGFELNICGKCALPGDYRSCKGLTCGPQRIDNGCGFCLDYDFSWNQQCICYYDSTFLPSDAGFGIFRFNDMATAIQKCTQKEIRMNTDGFIASPISFTSRDMVIRTDPVLNISPRTFLAYLDFEPGSSGFKMIDVNYGEPPTSCAGAGRTSLMQGSLGATGFNLTNVEVTLSTCASVGVVTVDGDASVQDGEILAPGGAGNPAFTLLFPNCETAPEGRHLNFTRNVGLNLYGGMIRASTPNSVYIVDNVCERCGGISDIVSVTPCGPAFQQRWQEIGRNTFTSNPSLTVGAAIRTSNMVLHNIYNNVASGLEYCIFVTGFPIAAAAGYTRGLPPEDTPYAAVLDPVPIGGARFLAHQNHRCTGNVGDISLNGVICDDLCGMDERDNIGLKYEIHSTALNDTALSVSFTLDTSVIHLEAGYQGVFNKSAIFRNRTDEQVSYGCPTLMPLEENVPCRAEVLDRQDRCIQSWTHEVPIVAGQEEIVCDFNYTYDYALYNKSRLDYTPEPYPFEWYRDPQFQYRILSVNTKLYLDEALTIPYDKNTQVIIEGTRVYMKAWIENITPELPGDRDIHYELEIDRLVLCFPNSSYVKGQDVSGIALTWPSGPVIPYHPYNPGGSGCFASDHGPIGEYIIYDRTIANASALGFRYSSWNASVYRLPSMNISEHAVAFNMQIARDTEVEGSITLLHNIIRRQFMVRRLYEWQDWQNISYIPQVDFRRDCPTAFYNFSDDGHSGFYSCVLGPPPPEEPEPDQYIWLKVGAVLLTLAGLVLLCYFIFCYRLMPRRQPKYDGL